MISPSPSGLIKVLIIIFMSFQNQIYMKSDTLTPIIKNDLNESK